MLLQIKGARPVVTFIIKINYYYYEYCRTYNYSKLSYRFKCSLNKLRDSAWVTLLIPESNYIWKEGKFICISSC